MSQGTSYNNIKAAIEAGERLTRIQGRSLLEHSQEQEKLIETYEQRINELHKMLIGAQIDLEHEQEYYSTLARKWNSLMDMLHAFIGHRLIDEGEPVSEQYRKALEKKFDEFLQKSNIHP